MLSETSWLGILGSWFAVLFVSVLVLIGLISFHLVKSYISSNPVAKSTPSNQFLCHLSTVGQTLIVSSFFDWIVHDVLKFKNYLFECFSVHLSRILTVVCMLFALSICILECFMKILPQSYLSLTQFAVDYLAGVVVLSAFMVSAYAEVGWCDSWDVCAVDTQCDAPFRQAFFGFTCLLIILILIGLTLNKTCLKKILSHFKFFFCLKSPQVQTVSIHGIQLATISSDVQEAEAVQAQPPPDNEEEIEVLVTPSTHLMTSFISSIIGAMMVGACYSVGHCSETFKQFCRIFFTTLAPAIWIWMNPKSRKFAVRNVRGWLRLEQ